MKKRVLNNTLIIIILVVLVFNVILLARVLGYFYLPGELTMLEKAKQGAQTAISYSEEMADSYGVNKKKDVIDILARFKYEVEKADSPEEVASMIIDYGRQAQDIIYREVQNKRVNSILNLINTLQLPGAGRITISRVDGEVKFLDPGGVLTEEVKEEIEKIPFNQTLEIRVRDKRASFVTTGDLFNQVDYLQTKAASLERQLKLLRQNAGYEPLNGSGIILKLYDNNSLEETGIVHDSDIRNIINELMVAGAKGVEVGDQRLTVTSSIRCVGPTVLVNNKPISVNPVLIKAVGDPGVLASSLGIIKKQLEVFGIKLEITEEKEITLKGQRGD